ncbi:MAG: TIGR02099 family protein [Gammaproteobacteria bacterium]|nr:TIGR02099 family protein [Gammaproteobacteria bacterium]
MNVKKTSLYILNKCWQLLAALVILFAVLVTIARYSMPYLNDNRDTIESLITDNTGIEISIDNLKGSWEASGPVLTINDIILGSSVDNTIRIKSIKLGVSTLPSLFYRTLITKKLTVEGLSLTFKQQASGKFIFPNIFTETVVPSEGNTNLVSSIQNWLQHQSRLLLLDTHIDISIRETENYPINIDVMHFIKGKDIYQLTGYSDLPGENQIVMRFEMDGFLTDPLTKGQLYIDSNEINMSELPLNAVWDKTAIDSGTLDIGFWADWVDGGFSSALMSLEVGNFQLSLQDEPQIDVELLKTFLVWEKQSNGWILESQQANIVSQGRKWPDPSFRLIATDEDKQQVFDFSASRLDLGIWAALLLTHPTLDSQLREQLLAMDIKGFLNDARLNVSLEENALNIVRANAFFLELGWQPWEKIPGVDNFSGQFEFHKNMGSLLLDSRHASIDYASLFRWPFQLDTINSQVNWTVSDEIFSLEINNLFLELSGTSLMADGVFDIHRNSKIVDMNLYAELHQGDIAKTKYFLPAGTMKENLVQYLDQSIQTGVLELAKVSLRGPSTHFPFVNMDGVFAINAQAKNTRYRFLPEWPEIQQIDADLWFVENSMDIRVKQAVSNGQKISEAAVGIENFSAVPAILTVKSSSQGKVEDGMNYINNSPLSNSVGKIFEVIPTKGPFELDLDLTIPLSAGTHPKVDGLITLLGNSMMVDPVQMSVENITGKIELTDSLLSATAISAEVMGGKSHFDLKQQTHPDGGIKTIVLGEGEITTTEVREVFPQWIPSMIEGKTSYDIRLLLPEQSDDETKIDLMFDLYFTSDLKGIISQFPAPFNKKTSQTEPFSLSYKLLTNKQQLFSSSLSDWADIKLHIQNDNKLSGQVVLGGEKASVTSHEGLEITGELDSFDLEPWLALLKRPELSIDDVEFDNFNQLFIYNLLIKDLKYYFMNFNQVRVSAKQDSNQLFFNLDSKEIIGNITIPDPDLDYPIDINLSLLNIHDQFPIKTNSEETKDKILNLELANSTPLPPIKIHCEKCIYNKQSIGSTWIDINPLENGNSFTVKTAGEKLLELYLLGEWKSNNQNHVVTQVSGNLNTDDSGELFQLFNIETGIRKTNLKSTGAVSWSGDLSQFNSKTLNGSLSIDGGKGSQKNISDKKARLFSLLSISSVFRRLSLDFSDLFGDGFYYDSIKGNLTIAKGSISTDDLEITGTSADVEIKGVTNIPENRIENCVRVTPKLGSSLPILAGWAIEPVTGLVVYLMSKIFQPVLKVVTSILYKVEGTLDNPEILELNKTSGTAVVDNSSEKGKTTITPDSAISNFNCSHVFEN